MGMIKFDNNNLFETAKAVVVMNPYLKGTAPRWVVAEMESIARSELHSDTKSNYVSTHGFVLTFFTCKHDPENVYVKASVESNTALNYVNSFNKKKEKENA